MGKIDGHCISDYMKKNNKENAESGYVKENIQKHRRKIIWLQEWYDK